VFGVVCGSVGIWDTEVSCPLSMCTTRSQLGNAAALDGASGDAGQEIFSRYALRADISAFRPMLASVPSAVAENCGA
jgi:hypothetical protein